MPRISKTELIKLQKTLKTDEAIGGKFGITRQAVHIMRKNYRIPPLPGARTVFKPPRITKDELIRLQKTLITDKAIGGKVGLTANGLRRWRKKYGIPAILIDNTSRNKEIVALYKKGMTGIVIAKKFGLHLVWVYQIIRKAGAGKRKAATMKLAAGIKENSSFKRKGK